ncbi:MAG: NUDIX hydrolase [Chloroflexi bacterium]|nr:NUDIX hydrolase [Chloroflexota bacterium]MBT7081476.1 NUDIX hydrolase [Chloroflexota bacterium]MBT7289757.1 NUDIX hydrolase [Chloroflexota bacterium]
MSEEKTIETKNIYQGRIISVKDDTVLLPNGSTTHREIVEHADVVAIVALDENDNVLLVKQYRKPVEKALLEIPAGGIEAGETPDDSAKRELQEEIGYLPGRMERIGGVYASPGYCNEFLYLYLATDLIESKLKGDDDENIEIIRAPLTEIPQMIASGQICDAKSVAALFTVIMNRKQALA